MPPRDHRARHLSPHLSHDGFLRLHLTLIRLRLRIALAERTHTRTPLLGLRDAEPGELSPDARRTQAPPTIQKNLAPLLDTERQLRAELVVAWQESRENNIQDPIHALQARFRLSDVESEALLLATAWTLDPTLGALFRELGSPHDRPCLLLLTALTADLAPTRLLRTLDPDGNLRRNALLRVERDDPTTPTLNPFSLDPGLLPHLLAPSPPLAEGMELVLTLPDDPRLRTQHSLGALNHLRALVQTSMSQTPRPALLLHTPADGGPHLWAAAVSQQMSRALLRVDAADILLRDPDTTLDRVVRAAAREACLRDNANLLLDLRRVPAEALAHPRTTSAIQDAALAPDRLVMLATPHDAPRGFNALPAPIPTLDLSPATRTLLWEHQLPADLQLATPSGLPLLAQRSDLDDHDRERILQAAAAAARTLDPQRPTLTPDVLATALATTFPHLATVARVLPVATRWSEACLDPRTAAQLRHLRAALQHLSAVRTRLHTPSTGFSALFTGPPGTGRSAAGVRLALEVGADLERLQLAPTERPDHLASALSRALAQQHPQRVLLLELVALPATPSTLTEHLHHALLLLRHRLLGQPGLVIIEADPRLVVQHAWLHAADFSVDFPLPAPPVRRTIWQSLFPEPTLLTEGLDFNALAEEFPLAVGHIERAATVAALHAAARPHPHNRVTFHDLWDAASRCCQLLDVPPPTLARV